MLAIVRIYTRLQLGVSSFAPFRVPATPIWIHSPFVNWLLPADNATGDWIWHVACPQRQSWIHDSGSTHRRQVACFTWATGPPMPSAGLATPALPQLGPANVQPTRKIHSYAGSGVSPNLTFATPTPIEDLEQLLARESCWRSSPLYRRHTTGVAGILRAHWSARSRDADSINTNASWARGDSASMRIFNPTGKPLREHSTFDPATLHGGQPTSHIDWGSAHLALPLLPSLSSPPSSLDIQNTAHCTHCSSGTAATAT
jgi:hypothetical protein